MSCSCALGARAEYEMSATDSHVEAWTPGEILLVEVVETVGSRPELKEAGPWEYTFEGHLALVPLSLPLSLFPS